MLIFGTGLNWEFVSLITRAFCKIIDALVRMRKGVTFMETEHRILVPLDGSECSENIIPKIETLASNTNRGICLLRVTSAHTFPGVDATESQVKVVREAEQYLQGWEGRLKAKGFDVNTHVRYGDDVEEILDHAAQKEIDLVAMSTHGHRGVKRILFGSVAEKVLRKTPKPVFVARCN
jgi:nucleotide-binding universal stress UspA family protein